ncbi:MAG: undecaprenyl-diphosphate phosphatase, partial [Granulosicoccaceae bacterium]
MIDTLQVIILALVQGLTEFLPVSSSAHLILVPALLGWPDQGIVFDVAVHLGTLIAVVAYFRRDIGAMIPDFFGSLTGKGMTDQARLAWGVGIGTIPAGLVGLAAKDFIEANLRSPLVIATTTVVFGLLLLFADRTAKLVRNIEHMGWGHYIAIGCAQALALIPGTSRSGITITVALVLGLTRQAAARFSFLLSIPVILLAGG